MEMDMEMEMETVTATTFDYAQRQLEWFGHYLKGEPAPEWIAKGEPYLTRKKILDSANPPQPSANAQGARGARGRGGS